MIENDYKYWNAAIQWWHEKAQAYLDLGMASDAERCIGRADLALMRRHEADGTIISWGPEIYARRGA